MTYPISETTTPAIDHVIAIFAFLICPSSPAAVRYMMPEITNAMIAINPRSVRSHTIKFEKMPETVSLGSPDSDFTLLKPDVHPPLELVVLEELVVPVEVELVLPEVVTLVGLQQ